MIRVGAAAALLATAAPVAAQSTGPVDLSAWATSDERRHGLSWSGGRATVGGLAVVAPNDTLRIEADALATRGARRHGGADAAIGLTAFAGRTLGGVRIEAGTRANLFPGGRGALDYGEGIVRADWTFGPARLTGSAQYAPRQRAIGGSLLHLRTTATVGIIGTPWTMSGALARTSGDTRDAARALRLRPDATYFDWRLGVERAVGPVILGVDYVGTDLRNARHAGDTLLLRVSLGL
jgi:hypothetical protein